MPEKTDGLYNRPWSFRQFRVGKLDCKVEATLWRMLCMQFPLLWQWKGGPLKSICSSQLGQYDMVKKADLASIQAPNRLEVMGQNQEEANRQPDHNTDTGTHVLCAPGCCTVHQLNFPGWFEGESQGRVHWSNPCICHLKIRLLQLALHWANP